MIDMLTQPTTREQWLMERRQVIGASDIGAILGLDRFRTPLDVYYEKLGLATDKGETMPMRIGKLLEDDILHLAAEEMKLEIAPNALLFRHPTYDCVGATPDGLVGDDGLVEAKSTRMVITDDVMPAHIAQLQYQMAATGRRWGVLAYLSQGADLRLFRYEAEEETMMNLIASAAAFWENHVLARVPPEPTTAADVVRTWPRHTSGKTINATPGIYRLLEERASLSTQSKELEKQSDERDERLKLMMGDAEAIIDDDGRELVSWRAARDTSTFDWKGAFGALVELTSASQESIDRAIAQNTNSKPGSRRFLLKK